MIGFCEWVKYDELINDVGLAVQDDDFSDVLSLRGCFLREMTPADIGDFKRLLDSCSDETLLRMYDQCRLKPEILKIISDSLEKRHIDIKSIPTPDFSDLLFEEMENQGFLKDSDFYRSINMSRQTFSKIRSMKTNGYVPGRDTVILIIVGLRVDANKANKMMAALGYSFNDTDYRERIIYEKIKTGRYSLDEIEELLYMLDLKPLASIV